MRIFTEVVKDNYGKEEIRYNMVSIGIGIVLLIIFSIVSLMYIIPVYDVWSAEMRGKAQYAEAEQNRNIVILEAQAKKDSAIQLAQAEVERAKGVAESNRIISGSITEPYLRYLWIQGLQTNEMQVVYIPTEGNLPILEATRNNGI